MPKILDYPHASFSKSLEMAEAIYELGGGCKIESCAHKMGKNDGGGFRALMAAASKYGLITQNRGQLSITELFREYKLSYSENDANKAKQKAFLNVPLFHKIVQRFQSKNLPLDIFDKLLIKEFGVQEPIASRVAKYFVDGARSVALLHSDNKIATLVDLSSEEEAIKSDENAANNQTQQEQPKNDVLNTITEISQDKYSVNINGPGINSTIIILEEEDIGIVELMLKKIRKKFNEHESVQQDK
ncbi:MAG: hypothetical protein HY807_03790 [Nitrospirae bacterium]|nr:hypothetical protein [Nitrospirota bacterium]